MSNKERISPQGYNYQDDPQNTNPFWTEDGEAPEPAGLPIASKTEAGIVKIGAGINVTKDGTISAEAGTGTKGEKGDPGVTPDITATATVSDTTGTPTVEVSKTGTVEAPTINFAFAGLKGSPGSDGKNGTDGVSPTVSSTGSTASGALAGTITGADGNVINVYNGARGEKGETGSNGENGKNGTDGVSPTVSSTGSTASGALAGTITGADGNVINVYNGARGEKGETGSGGSGGTIDESKFLTSISITNENGVYAISQTKDGTTAEVGAIEVPDTNNLIAEVKDSIVENNTSGYDYHTIKETENNGTENNVSAFYLAQKQITGITATDNQLNVKTVSQEGLEATQAIELPTTGGEKGDPGVTPDITATATVSDTTGTPTVEVSKTGTAEAPTINFAFAGLKGSPGSDGKNGTDGVSPTVSSTGSTASGALAGTITGADGNVINVYNGARGEKGETGSGGSGGGFTKITQTTNGKNAAFASKHTFPSNNTQDWSTEQFSIEVPANTIVIPAISADFAVIQNNLKTGLELKTITYNYFTYTDTDTETTTAYITAIATIANTTSSSITMEMPSYVTIYEKLDFYTFS